MTDGPQQPTPAGWYPDPENAGQQRYWDGNAWAPAGAPPPPQAQVATAPTAPPPMTTGDARARAKAEKAYKKASRPWFKKKRWWIAGVIVVIIVIAVAASSSSSNNNAASKNNGVKTLSGNGSHPPQADVSLKDCAYDGTIQSATADLTVVNHSSKRSNYIIDVTFQDSKGTQVGSGTAAPTNVEAGQTAIAKAVDFVNAKPDKLTCVVKEVNRFSS